MLDSFVHAEESSSRESMVYSIPCKCEALLMLPYTSSIMYTATWKLIIFISNR